MHIQDATITAPILWVWFVRAHICTRQSYTCIRQTHCTKSLFECNSFTHTGIKCNSFACMYRAPHLSQQVPYSVIRTHIYTYSVIHSHAYTGRHSCCIKSLNSYTYLRVQCNSFRYIRRAPCLLYLEIFSSVIHSRTHVYCDSSAWIYRAPHSLYQVPSVSTDMWVLAVYLPVSLCVCV